MNQNELKDIILKGLKQVAPNANVEELGMDENLRDALDIDSFDHLNFLIAIDEKLGVNIPEKDYGKLNTVAEVINYLNVRVA